MLCSMFKIRKSLPNVEDNKEDREEKRNSKGPGTVKKDI